MDGQPKEAGPMVAKVGGSLFDIPDLGARLERWLHGLPFRETVLIPGGGAAAEVVRQLDRCHALGEERSHWLALQALELNAHFLAAIVADSCIARDLAECADVCSRGRIPILDPLAFARADEGRPGALPHSWSVSSDSVAARVAARSGAKWLVLLKSIAIPAGIDWAEAGRRGLVDPYFVEAIPAWLAVSAINFRTWQA